MGDKGEWRGGGVSLARGIRITGRVVPGSAVFKGLRRGPARGGTLNRRSRAEPRAAKVYMLRHGQNVSGGCVRHGAASEVGLASVQTS